MRSAAICVSLAALLVPLATAAVWAQAAPAAPAAPPADTSAWTPPPLFASHDPLAITIRADLRTLLRDRDSTRRRDHEATMTVAHRDGSARDLKVSLRTRGHFRRRFSSCEWPPLRLRVSGGAGGTPFARQGALKLVTTCRPAQSEYEQYILREYLIYRTMELLTPMSFRARLARVTYQDASGGRNTETWGFFIEPESQLARRNSSKIREAKGARRADLVDDHSMLVAAFQFMIGNTDWSIPALHNIVLVEQSAWNVYAVPYDFDWSGIVDARYATPDSRLPIKTVRERLYRGYCIQPAELRPALDLILAQREQILALWAHEALSPRERERARAYLEEFFKLARDDRRLRSEIPRSCNGS